MEMTKGTAIASILEDFDFEKVHKVMQMLDWKWATTFKKDDTGFQLIATVPSVVQIKVQALELLSDAWDKKASMSTGGLVAKYGINEMEEPSLTLSFELESAESYNVNLEKEE